ncbi:MAG: cell division protein FtsL [Chloroflexi bacterium]|nr:cell division protein FtsL [Chloroflexota bacterium]MBU1751617.1 cell division protein FtsL [Chloroflexota bacterium]MBU1880004.1 cell division protein FtsL [Chloroflexota bacterium]
MSDTRSQNSPLLARRQWLQRLEAQGFRPLVALCALVCALCLLYLYQNSTMTTSAYAISQLEASRTHLIHRHEQLQVQVAELENLDRIQRIATGQLGMVEAGSVRYLQVADLPLDEPVVHALAPGVPAGPVAGAPSGDQDTSFWATLWNSIVSQFLAWGDQPAGSQAQAH